MRPEFKNLRLQQLDRTLAPFQALRGVARPQKGWIRAVRQALGLTAVELAEKLGVSRQLPLQLEKSEAEDRITLKSLRAVADALDCDLVYAFVPRSGSLSEIVEGRIRAEAGKRVRAVEHTMLLEDQAAGRMDEAVESETRRIAGKGRQQ
jgi:predicted DNA-binding mobile mystery protein A